MAAFIGGQMNKNLDRRRHMANDPDQCYYNSPKVIAAPVLVCGYVCITSDTCLKAA